MANVINATSTGSGGLVSQGDDSGILNIQTNEVTAITVDASQIVSYTNNLGTVAGYPAYQCRAWVSFNSTGTPAIRASGNVSSIGDFGTGDLSINFTNALVDSNYCVVGSSIKGAGAPGNTNSGLVTIGESPSTTAAGIGVIQADGTAVDRAYVFVAVFR